MPSYSEIMTILGFKSKNAVFKLVNKLKSEDFFSKDRRGKLIPKNMLASIKVLESVEAGFPTAAEEELADMMTLDEYIVKNKKAIFF